MGRGRRKKGIRFKKGFGVVRIKGESKRWVMVRQERNRKKKDRRENKKGKTNTQV
jgi:hypothetical protein